jgi:hypothetical protein
MQKSSEDPRILKKRITETRLHLEVSININNKQLYKDLNKKKDSEEPHHSQDLPLPGIKLFFLVHVIHAIILGTKL